MKFFGTQQVKRGLVALFSLGCLSPTAGAIDLVQLPATPSATPSAPPSAQCSQQPHQVTEALAGEWIERSRTLTQYNRPEQSAQALIYALQFTQRIPSEAVRADLLRLITEDSPTGILQELVYRAVASQQPEAVLSVFPFLLATARSLPTAYSSAKTQTLIAVARHSLTFDQPQQAEPILAEALQAAQFLQGAEFQTKALTAIAQGYQQLGEPDQAIELLDQSLEFAQQVQSNELRRAWTLQSIATTYAQSGALRQAVEVAAIIPAGEEATVYVRNETRADIAKAYGAANQIDLALQVANQITSGEIKAKTLAWLAGQSRDGVSEDLVNQAVALAEAEPPERRSVVLAEVALQVARSTSTRESINAALPIVDRIEDARSKAQTLVNLAALAPDDTQANELVNQALITAEQIEDINLRGIIINTVIEDYLFAEEFAIALQVTQSLTEADSFADKYSVLGRIAQQAARAGELEIALAATDSIPATWIDYRNQGFQAVAVGYARAGQNDRAMQLVSRIDNYGSLPYQVRTLAALAEQAHLKADSSRAEALLQQALQIANQLETSGQQADGLTAVAIGYAQLGQLDRAAQLRAQALQAVQSSPDPYDQAYQLRQIVEQYVAAQQYEFAIEAAQAIPEPGEQSRTLNNVATQLIEVQQPDTALQAAAALAQPEEKARFLVDVANLYIARGQLTEVNQVLTQALETANTIPGEESRLIQVREDLTVDDPTDRGSLVEAIALKYAAIGNLTQARQIAQTLQTPSLRDQVLQQLACYPETPLT